MNRFPQDLLPVLHAYSGPKGALSLATNKKALEWSKKEILKSLLYTTCAVLHDKVGTNRWMLRFPSPRSNSVVGVIFNFHYFDMTKKVISVQLVGESIGGAQHYEFHNVLMDKNLAFNFTFPLTKKDEVYTFLHWVIHKYYDRLEKKREKKGYTFSSFIDVYHVKHLYPKAQECNIVKISENPVFDHMKSCLTLLMNVYYG